MQNVEKKSNKIIRLTIKNIMKVFLLIIFRVKVIGQENIPEGACAICPKHLSNWDPPVIVACTKRKINMMAKDSLFKNGLIRWLAKIFGIFPVKRGMKDLEAIKNALRILKKQEAVAIYPEGTRKGLEKGLKPKNGAVLIAIKAKAPIVPVRYTRKF